jgi:hypothetical protein
MQKMVIDKIRVNQWVVGDREKRFFSSPRSRSWAEKMFRSTPVATNILKKQRICHWFFSARFFNEKVAGNPKKM